MLVSALLTLALVLLALPVLVLSALLTLALVLLALPVLVLSALLTLALVLLALPVLVLSALLTLALVLLALPVLVLSALLTVALVLLALALLSALLPLAHAELLLYSVLTFFDLVWMLLPVLFGLVLQVVEFAHCDPLSRWSSLTTVTVPTRCRRSDALPGSGGLNPGAQVNRLSSLGRSADADFSGDVIVAQWLIGGCDSGLGFRPH